MKKLIYFLVVLFATTSVVNAQDYASNENEFYWKNRKPNKDYWQQDVQYKIKASLSDSNDVIWGSSLLTYTNNSPDTLNELYFHLYQNAFIKGAYLENLNLANGFKQKFGRHEINGRGTLIKQLQVNGENVQLRLDNTILKVKLNRALLPGTQIEIAIDFETYFDEDGTQRRRMKLFRDNWKNKHYDGVHWYPRICVYDRKFGWETDQHLGKEFYGDFGSFDVELSFPHHFVLDATGTLSNSEEVLPQTLRAQLDLKNFAKKAWESEPSTIINPDPKRLTYKTWKFKAINVHDFAWTADPTYRIGESSFKLNNGQEVKVIALAQEPHAAGWQDACAFTARVMQIYSADFGNYMYPKMIVADARDGMEYPMLTLDGGSSPGYFGLLAHEVGHNWFFGMVGNNETYRASLDEGFTQFLTHWSTTRLLGEVKSNAHAKGYYNKAVEPVNLRESTVYLGYINDAITNEDMPLNTHSDDFNSALGHGGGYRAVYYKTATMLYNLQYVLGDSLFLLCMKSYFNTWKNCHPYFEDFRNSIIHTSKIDLNWFFDQWLETTKKIDYKLYKPHLKGINEQGNYVYEIKLKRKGEMQMPIDLQGTTETGKSISYTIPNTYFVKAEATNVLPMWKGWGILNTSYQTQIESPEKIKYLQIDSSFRLADINLLNNASCTPIRFKFDYMVKSPLDRKHYQFKWRPDIWWNDMDGFKLGLHLNGNYMQKKWQFKLNTWYNSDIANNYPYWMMNSTENSLIDYKFWFKTLMAKQLNLVIQSRYLDGLSLQQIGLEWNPGNQLFRTYIKGMIRPNNYSNYYVLGNTSYLGNLSGPIVNGMIMDGNGIGTWYTNNWETKKQNTSFNIEWERNGSLGENGNYTGSIAARTSILASDYQYFGLQAKFVSNKELGKFDLRSRLFASWFEGNIAPESKVYLGGANPEEMMENALSRSRGIIDGVWNQYGINGNHFQMGGGANIRGFNGYLAPVSYNNKQYFIYAGNKAASVNLELDYDRLMNISPKSMSKYLHIDAYLFADAGIIGTTITENNKKIELNSGFKISAGPGFNFQIKRFWVLDEIKPLNIRIDFPLWLSPAPFADQENFKYRWVLGINRSF